MIIDVLSDICLLLGGIFTLTGAIDANNGPIARVIAAYKDADQPLRAVLSSGNKVIRIESRNFQQETVVGTSVNDTFTNLDKR